MINIQNEMKNNLTLVLNQLMATMFRGPGEITMTKTTLGKNNSYLNLQRGDITTKKSGIMMEGNRITSIKLKTEHQSPAKVDLST